MLNLETKIPFNRRTLEAGNLTNLLSEKDLAALGSWVVEGFNKDNFSRADWFKRTQAAMDLALQITQDKSFPWPNCSNIAFPLVTIGAIQFHSRAYPALVQGTNLVKCRVIGKDPDGQLEARAERVSKHMSYQLLEEDEAWEEQHDRLLLQVPIVGTAFKKTYRDADGTNKSELVSAHNLVMDYYAKSVETCRRKTQIIPRDRNDILTRIAKGLFRDVSEEAWFVQPARPEPTPEADARKGTSQPASDELTPFTLLEQHTWIDFDGDGYAEPYVVTVDYGTQQVLRIVARCDRMEDVLKLPSGKIVSIAATEHYTKYGFIPAPDGGVYDIGFGILLGPLNESVNTLVNQLVDAGTMANTAGGFLARGAKVRSGNYTFAPLEWKRVDASGDDLRKSVFPLPVREPSAVLFQLLDLLINYTNRISASTDMMVGELPGQNTPAEVARTSVEQGMKIYSALFKRMWRCMRDEFRKLYVLNAVHSVEAVAGLEISSADYKGDAKAIRPAADPNITSDVMQVQQAQALKMAAAQTPGYDPIYVERKYLQALKIEDVELVYPGPDKIPPGKSEKIQLEEMRLQAKQLSLQLDMKKFVMELMEKRQLTQAQIAKLEADAAKAVTEAGEIDEGHKLAAMAAVVGALKSHDDSLRGWAETMLKHIEVSNDKQTAGTGSGGVRRMAGASGDAAGPGGGAPAEGDLQGAMGSGGFY